MLKFSLQGIISYVSPQVILERRKEGKKLDDIVKKVELDGWLWVDAAALMTTGNSHVTGELNVGASYGILEGYAYHMSSAVGLKLISADDGLPPSFYQVMADGENLENNYIGKWAVIDPEHLSQLPEQLTISQFGSAFTATTLKYGYLPVEFSLQLGAGSWAIHWIGRTVEAVQKNFWPKTANDF